MNRKFKYIAILAMLPLFSVAIVSSFEAAEAAKAEGRAASNYGSDTRKIVCGDRLCSDYPGGRAAFEEALRSGVPVGGEAEDDDRMEDDRHMDDDHMKDGDHMDDDHMKDGDHMDRDHMDDGMMMDDDRMMDGMMMDMDDGMMMDDDRMMDKDHMMDGKHMDDDHMMDKDHMDRDHMKDGMMMDDDKKTGKAVHLSRANVPATIPLHHGYYEGEDVHFIITDSSDPTHAEIISESQGWNVELAPLLANAPESATSTTYMFTNGVEGGGVHGFQSEVFTSTPAQEDEYSALTSHIHVTWNSDRSSVLTSEQDIMDAEAAGEIFLTPLDVVLNMPHIVWPDGQMMVKEDSTLTDHTPYGGGQVLDIDMEEMTVTFVAHRGWGPDGRTIYYILTDLTPAAPAEAMGVVSAPTAANLMSSSAAVDLFQFSNGLYGTGPLGFQPGIAAGAPGDDNYSPMWRIHLVSWDESSHTAVLENLMDISAMRDSGDITTTLARPGDMDHIVNCPIIDPFQ